MGVAVFCSLLLPVHNAHTTRSPDVSVCQPDRIVVRLYLAASHTVLAIFTVVLSSYDIFVQPNDRFYLCRIWIEHSTTLISFTVDYYSIYVIIVSFRSMLFCWLCSSLCSIFALFLLITLFHLIVRGWCIRYSNRSQCHLIATAAQKQLRSFSFGVFSSTTHSECAMQLCGANGDRHKTQKKHGKNCNQLVGLLQLLSLFHCFFHSPQHKYNNKMHVSCRVDNSSSTTLDITFSFCHIRFHM